MRPPTRILSTALFATLLVAAFFGASASALANDISTAVTWTPGTNIDPLAFTPGEHQVYRVTLQPGDWIVAYSWAPSDDPQTEPVPANTVSVFDHTAVSVASASAVTTDGTDGKVDGVVYSMVTTDAPYYIDYAYSGSATSRIGMFPSRPFLSMLTAQTMTTNYGTSRSIIASFTDSLYDYVPKDVGKPMYDVPNMWLEASPTGAAGTWRDVTLTAQTTDANGLVSYSVAPTTKTHYRWSFGGYTLTNAAWAMTSSNEVVITPRVALTKRQPSSARRGRYFTVYGTIKPAKSSTYIRVQARKRGTSKIYSFYVSASKGTYRATRVKLPYRGTWQIRTLFKGDSKNAQNWTGWSNIWVK